VSAVRTKSSFPFANVFLLFRAKSLILSLEKGSVTPSQEQLHDAYEIATEGFDLRQSLLQWEMTVDLLPPSMSSQNGSILDADFVSLSAAFFSATSIYLSGVFDYEIMHWQKMGIVVPNLGEDDIQMHVTSILAQTSLILDGSAISPLLVLFPLRVAGARSCEIWQQDCILHHLATVERTFPVASAFRVELKKVWARASQHS
jgi:hypothetical protein